MEQRVRRRESGIAQRDYVLRVAKLDSILSAAQLENFAVHTEEPSVTEVAQEVLVKAGWICE